MQLNHAFPLRSLLILPNRAQSDERAKGISADPADRFGMFGGVEVVEDPDEFSAIDLTKPDRGDFVPPGKLRDMRDPHEA